MTAKELAALIGKRGTIALGGMDVAVDVTDAKLSYGKLRYRVTPVAGTGETWVDAASIILAATMNN